MNIKNLLEYNPSYAESIATNEFYYLDTSTGAEERTTEATYNKGFATRKRELGASATVNCEIPLNKLIPNTKIEISVEFDEESNIIWQAGANCTFVVLRFQLFVPRLTLNAEGQKLYTESYLKAHKWIYLNNRNNRNLSSFKTKKWSL